MKRIVKLFCIVVIILSPILLKAQEINDNCEYRKTIKEERKQKDKEFVEDESSPLDAKSKSGFNGLKYFRASLKWKITARIELYSNPDTIKMKTTTERLPLYLVYGKAFFTINEKEFALTIYRNIGLMSKPGYEDYLFVPFTDNTSGNKSYGGGRYIDARVLQNDSIVIDFNRAYNPYCVYSKKYSCPIPPAENFLPIQVMAGEKAFKH